MGESPGLASTRDAGRLSRGARAASGCEYCTVNLNDQFVLLKFRQAFLAAIDWRLRRGDPVDQLGHPRLERAPGLEAEDAPDLADVGKAVPDVADAIFVQDLRSDI